MWSPETARTTIERVWTSMAAPSSWHTFLQAGTRDLFLSNAVRMHRALRKARVEMELHIFEAMPHGGFFGAPNDLELEAEMRRLVEEDRDMAVSEPSCRRRTFAALRRAARRSREAPPRRD